MPRQGKQLNIWIPDDVMASLEHWIEANQTTKTDGVIQAIQVLTGTHPEAPPDLRAQVQDLVAIVEHMQLRLDQLEAQALEEQDLHPEASKALDDLDTTLEEATREQLMRVSKRLKIRSNSRWTEEKLRQAIRSWQPD